MAEGGAQVEGLREFQRAIKQASAETSRELRRAMKSEVADPVAQRIKSNVPVRSGTWRRAIRPGATTKGAHITWGRAKVPYAGWMEFGGGIPAKANRTGPPRIRRERVQGGRYVYPEIGEAREEALETSQRVLARAFAQARLDIRS